MKKERGGIFWLVLCLTMSHAGWILTGCGGGGEPQDYFRYRETGFRAELQGHCGTLPIDVVLQCGANDMQVTYSAPAGMKGISVSRENAQMGMEDFFIQGNGSDFLWVAEILYAEGAPTLEKQGENAVVSRGGVVYTFDRDRRLQAVSGSREGNPYSFTVLWWEERDEGKR